MTNERPRGPHSPYKLKPKEDFPRANPPVDPSAPPADYDVYAWRAQEQAIEHQAGTDDLNAPPGPPSRRRRRDYWLLMTGGLVVFTPLIGYGFTAANPMIFVSAIAGLVIFTISITWIIWQVMSRY